MAEEKISELTELTSPADGDFLAIVDVSDTTEAASGTTKKIQKSNLSATIADASETVKGKVELATNAETLAGTDTERAITPANLEYARSTTGWIPSSDTITVTDEDTLTIASTDKTAEYGKGAKLKQTFTGGDQVKALDLEAGSSQYAGIVDGSQTGLDITGDITIEAWVKAESFPGTDMTIAGKLDTDSNQRSYRIYFDSNSKLAFAYSSDGTLANSTFFTANSSLAGYVSKWIHVAATVDVSEHSIILYVNGVAVSSTESGASVTSIYNSTADFRIGAIDAAGATNFFDGIISEVRVWNDIRTASEIRQNMFKNVASDAANLVGYWKLDNDYLDETSNNNDLTASGSPVFSTDVPAKLVSGEMFFNIIASAFSTNTVLTLTGGIDYYAQDATSTWYISYVENPQGFPGYFNWSPTFTGFSADPTGTYKFVAKGQLCFVEVQQSADGTSNAATFYITAPIAASIGNGSVLSIWSYAKDNSAALTAPGMVSYLTSGQNFRIDKTMNAADGWTTSGGKRVRFTLSYLI